MTTETRVDLAKTELSPEQLLEIYRYMLLTRGVDDRIRTLYLQDAVVGGVYSQLGHEAISVGTAYSLRPDDVLVPMHRDLGAYLVRGMEVRRIMAQMMGRATGYSAGKDNALHIGDMSRNVMTHISMLGASIPHAAGAALATRQRGEVRVSLTYVGDGAINTGDFHEGLNFAATLRLPMILIVENNQFAYSTPLSKQIAFEEIAQRAVGYGVPGLRIAGNDVLEVYRTTREAAERARRGEGPTLIECVTMRMRGHSEHDDASYVP
jgi:TPP-dependent pyruvate/acetoin dehydrogenase alpha subunit